MPLLTLSHKDVGGLFQGPILPVTADNRRLVYPWLYDRFRRKKLKRYLSASVKILEKEAA